MNEKEREEQTEFEKIPTAHYKDDLKEKQKRMQMKLESTINRYKLEALKDAVRICKDTGLFCPDDMESMGEKEENELKNLLSTFADQEKDWEPSATEPNREEKKSDSLTTKEKFNMLIDVKNDLYKAMSIVEARGNEDCLKQLLHNCDDRVTKLLSSLLD